MVLNCYVAKALSVKYQITAHRLCMALAKTNSIVMLAEKSLSWSSTTQWSQVSATTQLLWPLDTQAKSEHSQAYIVLT